MKIPGVTILTVKQKNVRDFAEARNRLMEKCKAGDWIFFLDSDETISAELASEISKVINKSGYDAFRVYRTDIFLGRELHYGENGSFNQVRLAKKEKGKWHRPVHEIWEIKGRIGQLKNPLYHQPHKSISSFLLKIDNYSSLEADYRLLSGRRSFFFKIVLYPPVKFIKNYIFKHGYRDGIQGLIMGIMMSFHSFLTWVKLYLHQK